MYVEYHGPSTEITFFLRTSILWIIMALTSPTDSDRKYLLDDVRSLGRSTEFRKAKYATFFVNISLKYTLPKLISESGQV